VDVEVCIPDRHELLPTVRDLVSAADEALLCVAFANQAGVHLLEGQLKRLSGGGRLLATTVFGSTTTAALHDAAGFGTRVRVFNAAWGTYHPKLYLARQGKGTRALVGSANLTSGLVRNVEVAALLTGPSDAPPLAQLWERGEALWTEGAAFAWEPTLEPLQSDVFDPDLWAWLRASVHEGMTVQTLAGDRPNRITQVRRHGLWVQTERSRQRAAGPQHIPAWMFNTAWDYLAAHGRLSNRTLLNDLNVHRSSAVCAILAQLPPVGVASRRPIVLTYDAAHTETQAAEQHGRYTAGGPG